MQTIKFLGIIPARAGSKGVKKKNFRMLNEKPLISYTIDEAKNSEFLDYFVVSSDDDDIKKFSHINNINFIERPKNISKDTTPMSDVIIHAIEYMQNVKKVFPENIVLLQPTTPFRTSKDIDNSIELYLKENSTSMVSLSIAEDNHPSRMYFLKKNKLIKVLDEPKNQLRQDLENVYHRNGYIYIVNTKKFISEGKILYADTTPFIMNNNYFINIDNEFDFYIANLIAKDQKFNS